MGIRLHNDKNLAKTTTFYKKYPLSEKTEITPTEA